MIGRMVNVHNIVGTTSAAVIASDGELDRAFAAPALSTEQSNVAAIGYALDCMPYGVLLVDAGGGLVFTNACGRAIIAKSGALSLCRNQVVAAKACETAILRESIAAAAIPANDTEHPAPRTILLSRAHPLPPLPVIVAPLRRRSDTAVAAIFVGNAETAEYSAD